MRRTLRHARTTAAHSRTGHAARTAVAASAAAVLAAGTAIGIAPAAQAAAAYPCVDQTFLENGYCTVAAGETVAFTIQGGPGGDGGDGYLGGTGGAGGLGGKVAGFYTNTTGAEVLVEVIVGIAGAAGLDGDAANPDGTDGDAGDPSSLRIDSSALVEVSGGRGGTRGIGDGGANGTDGDPGMLVAPDPLPAGWALLTPAPGSGKVVFSAYVAPLSSDAGSGPAPLIQQFGKPGSGTCADAASPDLNWAGVASGGWGESWAQWMNNGAGGAVCSRTLIYSPRGMWFVE